MPEIGSQRTEALGYFAEKFGRQRTFLKSTLFSVLSTRLHGGYRRNITPDKLPASVSKPLEEVCDWHLREITQVLEPEWVVGVRICGEAGNGSAGGMGLKFGRVLHPSPAGQRRAGLGGNSGKTDLQTRHLGVMSPTIFQSTPRAS